jgi:hypothetical protein
VPHSSAVLMRPSTSVPVARSAVPALGRSATSSSLFSSDALGLRHSDARDGGTLHITSPVDSSASTTVALPASPRFKGAPPAVVDAAAPGARGLARAGARALDEGVPTQPRPLLLPALAPGYTYSGRAASAGARAPLLQLAWAGPSS